MTHFESQQSVFSQISKNDLRGYFISEGLNCLEADAFNALISQNEAVRFESIDGNPQVAQHRPPRRPLDERSVGKLMRGSAGPTVTLLTPHDRWGSAAAPHGVARDLSRPPLGKVAKRKVAKKKRCGVGDA